MPPLKTRSKEEFMELYLGPYYKMFGMNESAYHKYFDENKDWFCVAPDGRFLMVDEDAKSLNIPNNDLRILDTAIQMWEKGEEVEKAKRILHRYTLMDFQSLQNGVIGLTKTKRGYFSQK